MAAPQYTPGDRVRIVSARHRVGAVVGVPERRQGQFWYPVFFAPEQTDVFPEEDLERYSGSRDIKSLMEDGQFAGREALSRLVTQLKLSLDLGSQIYALSASKTSFFPYQFKPLLKFFESRNHRLLIADEVGLGKTIEAGLILTELRHRRPDLNRVLVVVPAHLRRKWQAEMRRRFDRHFNILDREDLREFLASYERDGTETRLWGIVSLQTLSRAAMMEAWEAVGPELDLVVFDEAGRLRNETTHAHRVARLLGESSDAMLLLTATPVQTGSNDLFNLLRLLDPQQFSRPDVFYQQLTVNASVLAAQSRLRRADLDNTEVLNRLREVERTPLAPRFLNNPLYPDVVQRLQSPSKLARRERIALQRDLESLTVFGHVLSRTRKQDVYEQQPERRARVWRCPDVSVAEAEFYNAVTDLCRSAYDSRQDGRGASLGIIQAQRQMASCMVAMIDYIKDRLFAADQVPLIELNDESDEDPDAPSIQPDWAALGDLNVWHGRLRAHDSKLQALHRVVCTLHREEPGAKIIIFTHFVRTARYLCRELQGRGIKAEALTGATPTNPVIPELDERLRLLARFKSDPAFGVLVATNVAEEGLDLQFAHCMVNYDLPWNPMRIEQRIGRIDRIGQKAKVLQIVNLSMPNTIEDRMLVLLFERLSIFEKSIGDLETVMGNVIDQLQDALFRPGLSASEEEHEIHRAADVIERNAQDARDFERSMTSLIGQDEFFADEVERAKRHHRYVTGEELLIYLGDYINEQHPDSKLRPDSKRAPVFELQFGDSLRQVVRAAAPQDDDNLIHFLARTGRGRCSITTSPNCAEDDPSVVLLTFYHPLIRAVHRHYVDHSQELHPACYVRLQSSELPEGRYAWLLYSSEIGGVQPQRDLELVALHLVSGDVLDDDRTETLLWLMVAHGTNIPEARRHLVVNRSLIDRAEEAFVSRLNARFRARRRLNEGLVANRLASLRETYERNRTLRQQRVREATDRGRRASYIKGLKTRIRTLDAAYRDKEADIERNREMSRSFNLRAGGVVEVVHDGD